MIHAMRQPNLNERSGLFSRGIKGREKEGVANNEVDTVVCL